MVCFFFSAICAVQLPDLTPTNFDVQYGEAVDDYNKGNYDSAIKKFKSVIVNYIMLQHATSACASKCDNSSISTELKMDFKGFPSLKFFGDKLAYENCFKVCMEGHPYRAVSAQALPSVETLEALDKRQPYHYLQFCYFKTEQYKKCCEAVTTFLQRNPTDPEMLHNMEYYRRLPQVKESYFRDLEAPKFHKTYRSGVEAYESGKHKEAIALLEQALIDFVAAYEECKLLCHHLPFEQQYFHRIHKTAAVEKVRSLKCVAECANTVSPIIQDWKVEHFTARCFQFLQFSYYQVGSLKQAVACATSSFLLNPDGELARQNVAFYQQLLAKKGMSHSEIAIVLTPRDDAMEMYSGDQTARVHIDQVTAALDDVYADEGEVFVEAQVQDEEEDIMDKESLVKLITSSLEQKLL